MTRSEAASGAARGRAWRGPLAIAAGTAALALVPLLVPRTDVVNLLFLALLNVTLGQSWNILGGFAGQVNLGHAAFFGVGALVTRTLWLGGAPLALAFAAGGAVAVAFGLLIGVPTFRLRGAYFAIGTLGIAEVLRITVSNLLPLVSSLPPAYVTTYDLANRYELALALAAGCLLVAWLLLRSKWGLGILAVREDEDAAEASGVNALGHKLLALALSSLFAGLAGGLFAFYHLSYYPEFTFSPTWTFDAVLPVYVGGIGRLAGPLIGAVLYVVVREQLAVTLVQAHQVLFGVLFIAVVLALPGGLADAWSRLRPRRQPA